MLKGEIRAANKRHNYIFREVDKENGSVYHLPNILCKTFTFTDVKWADRDELRGKRLILWVRHSEACRQNE